MIDANLKSSLYLRNEVEIAGVTVTPILYLSNGKKLTLPDVKLEPAGTAVVNINDALRQKDIAPWATLTGYVEVEYKWPNPVCATLVNVDTIHSVIFTYGLRAASSPAAQAQGSSSGTTGTHTIEGMWWKQEPNVTGFVALSNTSGRPVKATLQVSDAGNIVLGEQTATISPHGTKLLAIPELQLTTSSAGGLRILHDGPEEVLVIGGGLEDQATGYSASMPFRSSPPASAKPELVSFAELGLMTGAADPMLLFPNGTIFAPFSVVRNISDVPVPVTGTLWWMQDGTAHSTRLPQFTLAPYRTSNLDFSSLLASAGLGNFHGSVNLVLDLQGDARSLLMASGSVDKKSTYVFQVVPRMVRESLAKTVSYWSTANGDDTMVTIWNPADEAQDLFFRLSFSGGHYDLPIHLEPRVTRMFNVSEIIQNQIPDREGNIIPPTIHEGSATILGVRAENEAILVAVDAGTYNVRKATCSYYCISCAGVITTFIGPNPFAVATSGTKQLAATCRYSSGSEFNCTSYSNWSSNKTNIATVSNTNRGLVTGVSPGGVTITSSYTGTEIYNPNLCGYDPRCPYSGSVQGSGPGGVGPYQVEPIFTASQGPVTAGNCPSSPYPGYVRFVTNQVQYQNGTAFAFSGLTVADTITVGSRHDLGSGTDTGTATTTGDGSFQDRYSVCSSLCPGSGGETDALQNWTANGVPLFHVNGLVYKCTSITIDGR